MTPRVAAWMAGRDKSVARAALGRDGRTINIRFRDGLRAAILPATSLAPAKPEAPSRSYLAASPARSGHDAQGKKALILEPFATEEIGVHDAIAESADLQRAGFTVDQLSDGNVTVASMASLSQYDVIYMHTHAGVNQEGYAVVSTGQLARDDGSMKPLIDQGEVMVVGVQGSSNLYYGVLIPYITKEVGSFHPGSLLYLDTCSLLRAGPLWKALSAKGLATFVSWDNNSLLSDETRAATLFFDAMAQGITLAQSLSLVRAAGLDTSVAEGITAHLGYRGDGNVTLASAGATPTPTTATPLPTVTPQATATAVLGAGPHLVVSLRARVRPSEYQSIGVQTSSGATVRVQVRYPNGDTSTTVRHAGTTGTIRVRYRQRGSQILPQHRRAVVSVRVEVGNVSSQKSRTYKIGFGQLDVAVSPRTVHSHEPMTIWVHSASGVLVHVSIGSPHGLSFQLVTDIGGSGQKTVSVPASEPQARSRLVSAWTTLQGKTVRTQTSFRFTGS